MDGKTFDLTAERGNVIVINFWATWCGPCRTEMPVLDEYYKKYKSQGLKVLAISVDDPSDVLSAKEMAKAFSFPVALRSEANYSGFIRVDHVPMTFVIDRKGIVRRDGSRAEPKIDAAVLDKEVVPLLKEK